MLLNPVHAISMGFGSGLSPFASGTVGTLAAIPIYLIVAHYLSWSLTQPQTFLLMILVFFILGCGCAHYTGKVLGVADHGAIVWDEVVGYLVTMFAIPYASLSIFELGVWILIGFFVFRFFDIFKPWPANWVDKNMKNGFGVMFDDVVAGVYSALVLYIGFEIFGA
ncbi:phosphatidylglycerophosphatase A [Beggiatoa alba]|nr:phosphatidylglycerophosphatase A [Beggiatoa alba]